MRLELKVNLDAPFELPATALLSANRSVLKGIAEEGLRHPLGIYNVSAGGVISATLDVLEELEVNSQLLGKDASGQMLASDGLRQKTKAFLLANGEHIDACEKVLKCCVQSDAGNRLRKLKEHFRSSLGFYEKHVMIQANHIKHRHSQVRNICLNTDSLVVPGYFIESSINETTIGPDPLVHGSSDTAFSYARQLRLSVCGLIFVSRSLSSLLASRRLNAPINVAGDNQKLKDMLQKVAEFSDVMMPDEYAQPYPHVRKGHRWIQVSYGNTKAPRVPYSAAQMSASFGGDGVTRSFRVPYFKSR